MFQKIDDKWSGVFIITEEYDLAFDGTYKKSNDAIIKLLLTVRQIMCLQFIFSLKPTVLIIMQLTYMHSYELDFNVMQRSLDLQHVYPDNGMFCTSCISDCI